MKKIYSCYLKIITTEALNNSFNEYLNPDNNSRDYTFLDMVALKKLETLQTYELKERIDKYLSKEDVNIDELSEDDLININITEKNKETKKVPRYIYEGKIYCTKTINPYIAKEIITGQLFYKTKMNYIPFKVSNFLTIDILDKLDTEYSYDMFRNYLLNKDIIKEYLNIVNNYCINLYEDYKRLYDEKNIKTFAEKKKEIKTLLKELK